MQMWLCISAYLTCTILIGEYKPSFKSKTSKNKVQCNAFSSIQYENEKQVRNALQAFMSHPYYKCSRIKKEK